MSFSMTGFGQSALYFGGYCLKCEIKSVNHRYCEIAFRMPKEWTCYEDSLRRFIQGHVKRGRIDVYISNVVEAASESSLKLNLSVVRDYVSAAKELQDNFGLGGLPSVAELMALPGVVVQSAQADDQSVVQNDEQLESNLQQVVLQAIAGLVAMREQEGQHLQEDLLGRLDKLEVLHQELVKYAPTVLQEYRTKLRSRLSELLDGVLEEQRFSMEVAIFADRSNVDEELTRLSSHLTQSRDLLGKTEPAGRKLDFLIQEMNREVNTIGSKANHLAIVNVVVEMKAELEKIREQAANLE